MGLKEIIVNGLDKIPGTDPIPGSNLGRKIAQTNHAPKEIKEWAKAEIAREKERFSEAQTKLREKTIFSSENPQAE